MTMAMIMGNSLVLCHCGSGRRTYDSYSNLGKGIELSSVVGLPPATRPRRTKADADGGQGSLAALQQQ